MFNFIYSSIFVLLLAVMLGKTARHFPDNTEAKSFCIMLYNGLIAVQVIYTICFLVDILR